MSDIRTEKSFEKRKLKDISSIKPGINVPAEMKGTMNELLTKGIGHTEFKDSELGRVPEGWEEITLETLVSVDSDSLKGNTDANYRFKYIDISCVSTGKVMPPAEKILFKDAPSRAKRVVKRGDVLVATVRPNLKAFAHFDEEGDGWVASTGFAVLRHKENSDSRFIYNIMLSDDVSRQIDRLVAGSNYPAISSSDVKELTLLSPPLSEQKKIASILTSVDEVIEETQSQIDKLQDLKRGTMNELLTKGIGHTEFKDSELGRIPKSWEITSISEITSDNSLFSDGDWVESKDQDPGGANRLIQLADIGDGSFIDKSVRFMNDEQFRRLNCTALMKDDILVARMPEPLGRACLFQNTKQDCATVVDVAIIRTPNTNPYWLMSVINSANFRRKIEINARGTTRTRISRSALSDIKINLPSLSEQKKIASILTSVDEVIEKIQSQIDKLKSLKKSLMQDLLTGKVRVSVN